MSGGALIVAFIGTVTTGITLSFVKIFTVPSRSPGLASLAICRVTSYSPLLAPGLTLVTTRDARLRLGDDERLRRLHVVRVQHDRAGRGDVGRGDFAEVQRRRLDAERRADHAGDADQVVRLVLGVGDDVDLLGERADLRVGAADGDR